MFLHVVHTSTCISHTFSAATCITEMAVLMSCWKQHDFTDADCSDEINLFNKCLADSEVSCPLSVQSQKGKNVDAKHNFQK